MMREKRLGCPAACGGGISDLGSGLGARAKISLKGYNGGMALRRTPHAVYDTLYHLVWSPKYRRDVLQGEIQQRVRELLLILRSSMTSRLRRWRSVPIMSIFFVPSRHGTPSLKWSPASRA